MKKIIATLMFLTLFIAFFSSFIGYEDGQTDAPGTIQCIGNAGSDNVFTFRKWEFLEATVPNGDFEQVKVSLEINTSSLTCDWKDLEKSLKKKKDYFYVKKFPKATVMIDGAQKQGDGSYIADASLTLKGITKVVPISFTVSEQKPYIIKGSGELKRRKFNFTGGGPKNEVPIMFEVTLPSI